MNKKSGVTDTVKCGRIGLYYYYCAPEKKIDSVQLILPPKLEPVVPIKSSTTTQRKILDPIHLVLPPKLEPTKKVPARKVTRRNSESMRPISPTKLVSSNNKSTFSKNIIRRNIKSIRLLLTPKLEPVKTETTRNILRKKDNALRLILHPKSELTNKNIILRRKVDSFQLVSPPKLKPVNISRKVPHYKIVAGTRFAVDAFSYGEIPNVNHYFLTHFHSDHYSGLRKGFKKLLFCSRITADLCVSRLGVSPKSIHIINIDEPIYVEGIEVTAVDANHCPGALMLVFTLPNGKTLLHTGDFRACPAMESYPTFWNKDIHTIYLDTTYCNPRYDFPTQDQILEMALSLLRQKKMLLENEGKKFSSVLIVCGTYTIGKEKLYMGIARRVGCSVWTCPQKDRALRTVKGRGLSHLPAQSCQLHVLPMEDLTHEKLRKYLDRYKSTFSEVVAFKPSGWENDKNSTDEKDLVTIHGIPYSDHSSFSELIRFVKFLKPKLVVPTVNIIGGTSAIQIIITGRCYVIFDDESKLKNLHDLALNYSMLSTGNSEMF